MQILFQQPHVVVLHNDMSLALLQGKRLVCYCYKVAERISRLFTASIMASCSAGPIGIKPLSIR